MKKISIKLLTCWFWLLAIVLPILFFPVPPSKALKTSEDQGLECEISVAKEVHVIDGWIDAHLIVRNVSERPLRISSLCTGSRHVGTGDYLEIVNPDSWRSNKPRPERFRENIVTLYHNEDFVFPIKIHFEYFADLFRGRPLKISSGYSISERFAKEYGTWTGSIEAKPVTVDILE